MRIILITAVILFNQYSFSMFSMLMPFPETPEYVRMIEDIASVALEKLSAAIECKMEWRVKELLEEHPNIINRSDSYGYTSLSKAALYNSPTICKILLDYKADPNIGNKINITPLHVAKNDTIMNLLLNAGADINVKDDNGTTPLLSAMYNNERNKIDFLLRKGAYIDQVILKKFEKNFRMSMFSTQETNEYFREIIKNMVLPFLAKQTIEEQAEKEEKEEKVIEKIILTTIECFICMDIFNIDIKDIKYKIPCFEGDDKLRHEKEFLCISCCNKIRAINNTCPLCRKDLKKEINI